MKNKYDQIVLLVAGILLILVPGVAISAPDIEFSPGTGVWNYTGTGPATGTFTFSQTILVDWVQGGTGDPLVAVGHVRIPDLALSGVPGGSYTLSPITSTITITDSTGTLTYLTGTLASGGIVPTGTTASAYTVFQADITNITVSNTIGSAVLDAFGVNGSADFDLSLVVCL